MKKIVPGEDNLIKIEIKIINGQIINNPKKEKIISKNLINLKRFSCKIYLQYHKHIQLAHW